MIERSQGNESMVSDKAAGTETSTNRRRFLKNSLIAGGGVLLGAGGLNAVSPWIWREPLALETNGSFWARSQAPLNPALAADLEVDAAVLGGGLTGLSTAYFIRQVSPGKSVAVLEARGCGNGASGRNGAMLLTMTADRYMSFSADPAMDRRIYDLTVENIRFLSSLSAWMGMDCELQTLGALQVFAGGSDAVAAGAYVRQARLLGMPVEMWDAGRVADAVGTGVYEGGFFDPNGGQVHPMKLVGVFKAAAERAGAVIYENTEVVAVEEGGTVVLHTRDGRVVRARSLVLASNAFTPNLGFLRNSMIPLREYVAMTRPLSEQELKAIGWRLRVPFNDSRTEVFYLGLTREGRIHIGGGAPEYEFNHGVGDAAVGRVREGELLRELGRLFPRLAGIGFDVRWDGIVDWSLDASPSVGVTGRHGNVFYGLGYSGHGVNLSSVFGRIIADLEAGRGEAWARYPFVNASLYYVPNEPFRWAAAKAGMGWYGMTERGGG
jgi:gamma-glutamylputrescine oxidase